MASGIDPRVLANIANPTGGKLTQIGGILAEGRQRGIENKRADEKLVEDKKTADLARQVAEAQLETIEVGNLLNNSKILSGVTDQFRLDVQKNPKIATDPNVYNAYMTKATEGLPDDVVSKFQGILPNQIETINRHSKRMVNVLTDVVDKKAPTTRKVGKEIGGEQYVIDQEWNTSDNTWTEVGRSKKSSGVTVNTGMKEDSKFAYAQLTKAVEDSKFAQKEKDNLSYIKQAVKGIDTGALTDVKIALNRVAASLDLPIDKDIPSL